MLMIIQPLPDSEAHKSICQKASYRTLRGRERDKYFAVPIQKSIRVVAITQ
jgi:hypothetical protein